MYVEPTYTEPLMPFSGLKILGIWRAKRKVFRYDSRSAVVERQQLAENVVVRDVRRPIVGGSYSRVKGLVCIGEPLRAGVVEVCQRAFFERFRRLFVARYGPLRVAGNRLVGPLDPFGRVEPAVTQFDEASGFLGYSHGTRVGGVLGCRSVRSHAGRERERVEGGCRRVAWVVALAKPCTEAK